MGGAFLGSQKQPHKNTVFDSVEQVLFTVFKQKIRCVPCGRTDSGVSASCMTFHADFSFIFEEDYLCKRLNRHLINSGIIIRSIEKVPLSFHALSSALSRTYKYFFTFDQSLPHYLLSSVTFLNQQPLFIPSNKDLQNLLGSKNFRYLSNSSDKKSTIRTIYSINLSSKVIDDLFGNSTLIYCLEITADGFLYRMVRHIVGLLLHSMLNFTNMDRLYDYINVHRGSSYNLAPAEGLHLVDVKY